MNAIASGLLFAWVFEALALGYVMRRRGFDGYVWMTLGLFLGPIALAIAVSFALHRPHVGAKTLRRGGTHAGVVDVLVGVDGSPESAAALAHVTDLVGERAGRIALARVTPFDVPPADAAAAEAQLRAAVAAHPELDAEVVVLHGEPAATLESYAADNGYELVVIGARGAGRTRRLLGSVATALARGGAVPVLLVDGSATPVPAERHAPTP